MDTTNNELFAQCLLFAAQVGFAADVAPAAGACLATWRDDRMWAQLVRVSSKPLGGRDYPNTALTCAAATPGGWPRVAWLIDAAGADPDCASANAWAPLHWACAFPAPTTVAALLRRGATPWLLCAAGHTPMRLALSSAQLYAPTSMTRAPLPFRASAYEAAVVHLLRCYAAAPAVEVDDVGVLEALLTLGKKFELEGRTAEARLAFGVVLRGHVLLKPAALSTLLAAVAAGGSVLEASTQLEAAVQLQLLETVQRRTPRTSAFVALFRVVLERRRALQGGGHPDALRAMHTLARILTRQRTTQAEAAELLRGVVEARTASLGADAPDTLDALDD